MVLGNEVQLADVCFEGPLGTHLKTEVRERIWKGEFVEIFSLLPLETYYLDRVKPYKSKKEERRRYRLIWAPFPIGSKPLLFLQFHRRKGTGELLHAFCYLNSIREAYRVYRGNVWLLYDEQFCQWKAVRPSIWWVHKDIGLWMRLMSAPRDLGQPFRGMADGLGSAEGRSAASGKGCCWQVIEGHCKFRADCRYRHECSGCRSSHGLACCFRQGKGRAGETELKRSDPGEGGKDVPYLREYPKVRRLRF